MIKLNIGVKIREKIASAIDDNSVIICGNSGYVIEFDFDSEWDSYSTKTARFSVGTKYMDVKFTGNKCSVPILRNVFFVKVGVFAGDLTTSTPAIILCKKSIICEPGEAIEPSIDVTGEVDNTFEYGKNVQSLGEGCVTIGNDLVSGCKGYYIQAIDFNNKKIYLTDTKVDGLPTVGEGEVTDLEVPYVYNVTAEPVYFSITNGNHYILCGTIKSIENNVVTYSEDSLGFNGFVTDTGIDGHTFHVPTQPTVGVISFITNAVSIGNGIINVGKCTFGAGRDNILLSDYGVNIGRGNTTGYGSFTSGRDNYIPAQFGLGSGNKNNITGYAGIGIGIANDITGDYSCGIGDHLKVYGLHQFVRGLYNIPDYENKYLDIVGDGYGGENARSNAYTLDRNGNARFKGKAYIECENGIGEGKELATKESVDKLNKSKGMVFKGVLNENTLPSTMLPDLENPNYEIVGDTYKLKNETSLQGYAHRFAAGASIKIYENNTNYLVNVEMRSDYLEDDLSEFARLFKILGIVDMDFQFTNQDTVISCDRFVGFHVTTTQATGAEFTGEFYTANITEVEYNAETSTIMFKGTWLTAPTANRYYNHPRVAYSTDNIYNAYSPYVGYYKPIQKELNRFPKDKMVTYSLNCGWVDF